MKKLILFLCGTGILSACRSEITEEQIDKSVKVWYAETPQQHTTRSYTFISKPFRTTELSFRVGGPVSEFEVQNGQFFRKGETIAAIDDRDFLVKKERAEAIYLQAEAEYNRVEKLYRKDNVSAASYEKARAEYQKAKADYDSA